MVTCGRIVLWYNILIIIKYKNIKEKDIQREFGKKNQIHGVHELKIMKGTSIAFSRLEDHQEIALERCNSDDGHYEKISDMSMGKKGFDCFLIKNYPAYVVVCHYVPRKTKRCYYIPIVEWKRMRADCGRKSATPEMLDKASLHILDL